MNEASARGAGVFNKVLYGEAPPGGPTPYPFHISTISDRLKNGTAFTYLIEQTASLIPFLIPGVKLMNDRAGKHQALPEEMFKDPYDLVDGRPCFQIPQRQISVAFRILQLMKSLPFYTLEA